MPTEVGCHNCDWKETIPGNPVDTNPQARQHQIDHECENPDTYRFDTHE